MKVLCMLPAAQGVYPPEAEQRRFNVMQSYATPATQIDVDYMPEPSGFSPWGGQTDPEHHQPDRMTRAHSFAADLAEKAERDGYDAFCPYGLLDIGVAEARRRGVKIPVVGQYESAALLCGLLGRRFASCSYVEMPALEEHNRERLAQWGLAGLYGGSTAIGIPNSEYPQRHDEVRECFVRCAREARDMGAEVMALVAMSICPTEFSAKELSEVSGLPVLDALSNQIAMAEMWHRTGLPPTLLKLPR
jgi:Asp/Glu/hydantoin racemase